MPTPGDHPAAAGQVPTDQFLAHQMGVPVAAAPHGHPPRAIPSRRTAGPRASTHRTSPSAHTLVDGAEAREHASTTTALQSQAHVHPHEQARRWCTVRPSSAVVLGGRRAPAPAPARPKNLPSQQSVGAPAHRGPAAGARSPDDPPARRGAGACRVARRGTTPMASPNLSASAIGTRPAFGSSACNAVSAWTRCTSTWVRESAPRPSGSPESPVVGGDRSRR